MSKPVVSAEELARCTAVLEAVARDALLLGTLSHEERIRLFMAAGRVIHPEQAQVRRRIRAMRSEKKKAIEAKDREVRAGTAIRAARRDSVFIAPPRRIDLEHQDATEVVNTRKVPELQTPRRCYVCKDLFVKVHFFYDSMCPKCGPYNYEKRFQTANLKGQVAIITGARLKIGYQSALMLLRAGARVIVTTRFPKDAALRFSREADFGDWSTRLQIFGLDLRHLPSVELFCSWIERHLERLDILINNAAQTVRRPPGFYAHLMELETRSYEALPDSVRDLLKDHERLKQEMGSAVLGLTASAALSQIAYGDDPDFVRLLESKADFPVGQLDADLQQVDHRRVNSWRMTLAEVPTAEMLEVQLVNSVSPFILCGKLKALMMRDRTDQKHIVNVSAMEGKFSRHTKTDKHPHTNMAKAALNMMTLTSARDYAQHGIFMNAVDTGWVTDEDPAALSARKQENHDFQPPLDIVDGAARVCDPIFSGALTGKHSWGNFLKDYFPTAW